MITQTPATAEIEVTPIRVRVFHEILTPAAGSKKTQDHAGVHSGTPDPWPPLVWSFLSLHLSANVAHVTA